MLIASYECARPGHTKPPSTYTFYLFFLRFCSICYTFLERINIREMKLEEELNKHKNNTHTLESKQNRINQIYAYV